jgi:DNA-binding GntR family transcriptional regulator
MTPIVTEPLGRQVARALRRDLLMGVLRPGEVLRQDRLCERFGVSRIPVRDALLELANEGFLIPLRKRGLQVATFRQQDIEDAFELAAHLHGRLIRRAAERASDQQLDLLVVLQAGMEDSLATTSLEELWQKNNSFHRQIDDLAQSPKLVAALRDVRISLFETALFATEEHARSSILDYAPIVDVMRRRDVRRAEELASAHLVKACSDVIRHLHQVGILTTPDDADVAHG